MNEFKGTPGPWAEINGSVYAKSEGICAMLGSTTRPIPKANSSLIAAAPELLEALQDLLHGTFPDGVEDDGSGRTGFNKEAIARYKKAELAIAKALGK